MLGADERGLLCLPCAPARPLFVKLSPCLCHLLPSSPLLSSPRHRTASSRCRTACSSCYRRATASARALPRCRWRWPWSARDWCRAGARLRELLLPEALCPALPSLHAVQSRLTSPPPLPLSLRPPNSEAVLMVEPRHLDQLLHPNFVNEKAYAKDGEAAWGGRARGGGARLAGGQLDSAASPLRPRT